MTQTRLLSRLLRLDLWVADPCDLDGIAAIAAAAGCGLDSSESPPRLLCGPLPLATKPWDPEGCAYLIACDAGCIID